MRNDPTWVARFAKVFNDVKTYPGLGDVAAELGIAYQSVRNRACEMRAARAAGRKDLPELIMRSKPAAIAPAPEEQPKVPEFTSQPLVKPDMVVPASGTRYFIFTSAQDSSRVHEDFLRNLEAYAEWLGDCQILIGGFTYQKGLFEEHSNAAGVYNPRVKPYLSMGQAQIGDRLLWCGEMNTLPTAVTPLSGFETYTRDKWGIFPHPKVQLLSVPNGKNDLTKILMTTGCVTLPNYVAKKAGIKASFHHMIGAVLVELEPDGTFFCRHLLADGLGSDERGQDEGGFYDLDRRVDAGEVTTSHRLEAINYGDIHHEKLDPEVAMLTWGYDTATGWSSPGPAIARTSLLDRFRPRHQFFHDLSDFAPRNHHNIKDHHFRFQTHTEKSANVETALEGCARFLQETHRPWCNSVVVQSNHDNALMTWLKSADYREDPENAVFYLRAQLELYEAYSRGRDSYDIFQSIMRQMATIDEVRFVGEDSSYTIAGGIECAMHGHLGANGSRGSPRQFTRMGAKSNTGHTHSAQIIDGAYVAGVSGKLDMGYNRGMSSWSHSHIFTYSNGKRAIVTKMGGQFFAGQTPLARVGSA